MNSGAFDLVLSRGTPSTYYKNSQLSRGARVFAKVADARGAEREFSRKLPSVVIFVSVTDSGITAQEEHSFWVSQLTPMVLVSVRPWSEKPTKLAFDFLIFRFFDFGQCS
jgi:hypothetical protein